MPFQSEILLILIALLLVGVLCAFVVYMKRTRQSRANHQIDDLAVRLKVLSEGQEKLTERMQERLDKVNKHLGEGLHESSEKTAKSLGELQQRLTTIDKAQDNITKLSNDVVGLQDILSNKQARGAFGEIQLNDMVSKALPPSFYEFQATLSNGRRVDCLINLPNPPGPVCVDSKFPLESYQALQNGRSDEEKKNARRQFRMDLLKHLKDISSKYILPGETADYAFMFLPSEAVFAELHSNFIDVVEKSQQVKVAIVSPTTLMATLTTTRAFLNNIEMNEQAGVIQKEVVKLLDDLKRLEKRADNLAHHFSLAEKDLTELQISRRKITNRAQKIENLELDDEEPVLIPEDPR